MYVTDVSFDTLAAGDYWIYLRDDAGFTLANCCRPIEFTMCEPDSLELLTVTWEKDVECAGDSTGAFSIQVEGGTPPYMYAYTWTAVGDDGHPYPGIPNDSLFIYPDSIIDGVPVGTYIGWVMDANGCKTGCEINSEGYPIDNHRVVIQEADALTFDDVDIDEPACYGGLADIELEGVTGGSGDSITFVLSGTTYDNVDTTYTFGPFERIDGEDYDLDDVYASDDDGYVVRAKTDNDCESAGDTIHVGQPDIFMVDIVIASGAVCEGDNEVLITIETIGGSAPFTFDIYADDVLIREGSTIVNHVVAVGAVYRVIATDDEGCSVEAVEDIPIPLPINFSMLDISCYGDSLASARVVATGTPGRSFQVQYKEIENDIAPSDWTIYNGWFTESVDMLQIFVFDDENLNDVHYAFIIVDDMGCESIIDTMTFDKVQNPIQLFVDMGDVTECTQEVTLNVVGGIAPYVVTVDSVIVTEMTMDLLSGEHEVVITDTHLRCMLIDTIVVVVDPVVRDTTIETSMGDSVQFVDAEAGLDTLLAIGTYSFTYMGEAGCNRELNVVIEDTTAPTAVTMTPQGELDEDDTTFDLVLTLSENVVAGAGNFTVYGADSAFVIFDVSEVTISGDSIYVPVSVDKYSTYYVFIDEGFVTDVEGNPFAGISVSTDWTFTTKNFATGIDPDFDVTEFKVYPNPFNNMLNIVNHDKLTRVVISNIAGQRVIDIAYPNSEIRTDNLVSGIYVISLITESGIAKTEKIIKK